MIGITYKTAWFMCHRIQPFGDYNGEWQPNTPSKDKKGIIGLSNLQLLCLKCHDIKTAREKSDAARQRHSMVKVHRWHTHRQKDEEIARLRARLAELGENPI